MEPDVEPWDRFRDWLHCICVVTFDLELGQALEVIYPGDAILSNTEKINICYLAFPDSNSSNAKDTNFHFRIRRAISDVRSCQKSFVDKSPSSLPFDAHYLYGFVHFRQCKDATIHRGYYQKSIVLMSVLPLFSLFYSVTARIAEHFFENGEAAIEAACHHIDTWLQPQVGRTIELPLLGTLISCRLPAACDLPYEFRLDGHVELSDHRDESMRLFRPDFTTPVVQHVHHLQLLWELILLGEPLLIVAPNPMVTSSLVQSIVGLLSPLRIVSDFRPYFTIHDSEFREYSSKSRTPMSTLIVRGTFSIFEDAALPEVVRAMCNHFSPQLNRSRYTQIRINQNHDVVMVYISTFSSIRRNRVPVPIRPFDIDVGGVLVRVSNFHFTPRIYVPENTARIRATRHPEVFRSLLSMYVFFGRYGSVHAVEHHARRNRVVLYVNLLRTVVVETIRHDLEGAEEGGTELYILYLGFERIRPGMQYIGRRIID